MKCARKISIKSSMTTISWLKSPMRLVASAKIQWKELILCQRPRLRMTRARQQPSLRWANRTERTMRRLSNSLPSKKKSTKPQWLQHWLTTGKRRSTVLAIGQTHQRETYYLNWVRKMTKVILIEVWSLWKAAWLRPRSLKILSRT